MAGGTWAAQDLLPCSRATCCRSRGTSWHPALPGGSTGRTNRPHRPGPLCAGRLGGLQRVARSRRWHSPGRPCSPALPASQLAASIEGWHGPGAASTRRGGPGEPLAVSPSALGPSSLRRCLSFPRLPAGSKAVNTAPVPGQPPHDESDRKTEPRSSVSDLVNSLTSEMLMVGGWGAPETGSPGMASHPGHRPGVSSRPLPPPQPFPTLALGHKHPGTSQPAQPSPCHSRAPRLAQPRLS